MKVEVLYFEGCPNHGPTVDRVREVLRSADLRDEIREMEVRTQAEAEVLGFLGSPSVRINGLDIEREARNLTNYGMSCRTYLEGTVRSGLPSRDLIRRALDEQMTQAAGGTGSGALFAGGLAAILASTCCLGPLVLITLGLSGAWISDLTRLEPFRPFFIGAALVALFFAGRRIFRPAEACKPGEVCALPQTRGIYKILFGIVSVLTLIALASPFVAKLFY